MSGSLDRGVSPVVATVLMVAVVVVLAATVGVLLIGVDSPSEPPRVVVSVDERQFTEGAELDDEPGACDASYEVGFLVQIDVLDAADRIYVVVRAETGETLKTVWDDPEAAGVGSERFLANEQEGNAGVDVDIGEDGSDDWAVCPDESGTLAFYAEYEGDNWLLTEYEY